MYHINITGIQYSVYHNTTVVVFSSTSEIGHATEKLK